MVILVDINGNLSISVRPYTTLQAKRWNALNKDHGFAIGPIRFWPDDMSILAMQDNSNNLQRCRLMKNHIFLSYNTTHSLPERIKSRFMH